MDNGLLLGLFAFIIFSIMLIISISNDTKKKKVNEIINIVETSKSEEQAKILLTELLLIEKSSNAKLNIIMWIMLIPIIINLITIFLVVSAINEIITKLTSLL